MLLTITITVEWVDKRVYGKRVRCAYLQRGGSKAVSGLVDRIMVWYDALFGAGLKTAILGPLDADVGSGRTVH
jgi:hypothetical protein